MKVFYDFNCMKSIFNLPVSRMLDSVASMRTAEENEEADLTLHFLLMTIYYNRRRENVTANCLLK